MSDFRFLRRRPLALIPAGGAGAATVGSRQRGLRAAKNHRPVPASAFTHGMRSTEPICPVTALLVLWVVGDLSRVRRADVGT